jgi:putative DNA primase/helicase
VRPYALRQHGEALLVPLVHDGQVVNVQRIYPDGSKRFLSGGMVSACFSPLGLITPGQALYICEGWATGVSIAEATGLSTVIGFDAGNLLPVAKVIRAKYKTARIVIAADNDESGTGQRAAAKVIKNVAT